MPIPPLSGAGERGVAAHYKRLRRPVTQCCAALQFESVRCRTNDRSAVGPTRLTVRQRTDRFMG